MVGAARVAAPTAVRKAGVRVRLASGGRRAIRVRSSALNTAGTVVAARRAACRIALVAAGVAVVRIIEDVGLTPVAHAVVAIAIAVRAHDGAGAATAARVVPWLVLHLAPHEPQLFTSPEAVWISQPFAATLSQLA